MTREMKCVEHSLKVNNNKNINLREGNQDALIKKKKYISKYNFEINLLNGWRLMFDNYYIESNRLKLSLRNGKKKKVIYSTIDEIKDLVIIIRENKMEIIKGFGCVVINTDEIIRKKLIAPLNCIKFSKKRILKA